jgi:hypothetical protein
MSENVTQLPIIPCPSCGANILEAGFHNTCTERMRVREDNFTYTKYGRLYLERKHGDGTVGHESDFEVGQTPALANLRYLVPRWLAPQRGSGQSRRNSPIRRDKRRERLVLFNSSQ